MKHKIKSDFDELEKDIRRKSLDKRKIRNLERRAIEWFKDKTGIHDKPGRTSSKTVDMDFKDFIKGKQGIKKEPVVGQMFTYQYDPKLKLKLPYYDLFPLMMPISMYDDGFLGLNVHYLPPYLRIRLLGLIRGTMRSKKLSREARAKISYELIKSTASLKIAKPAIKRYLTNHVRSRIVRVHPQDWEKVIFLPYESFQKKSREAVWKESLDNIF